MAAGDLPGALRPDGEAEVAGAVRITLEMIRRPALKQVSMKFPTRLGFRKKSGYPGREMKGFRLWWN